LSDEEGGWVEHPRKRLREKFARRLAKCLIALQAAGEREAAARLLERAMDVDPDAVNRFRELMVI
jgi:two-component SAPR family response regulator